MLTHFFHGRDTITDFPNHLAVYSQCHTTFNMEILESLNRIDSAFFFIVYDNNLKNTGMLYQVKPYNTLKLAKEDGRALYITTCESLINEGPH